MPCHRSTHLRTSSEFRKVYANGKRFDGNLVTAFALPNGLAHHRLGITASRKAIGNAVQRNRAKRLLRESFRLNAASLEVLPVKYDWVLNAKRGLLQVKIAQPLEDLNEIISRVTLDKMETVETVEEG